VDLAIYREKDVFERRNAANEAKKALLERFKAKPAADDPAVLARQAERKAAAEAARIAAEEAAMAEAKIKEAEENERIARLLADEAERKAKRDARYAARKQRTGRTPPGFSAR
jgi:hypothetical protein